jgi:hypothetical protein
MCIHIDDFGGLGRAHVVKYLWRGGGLNEGH